MLRAVLFHHDGLEKIESVSQSQLPSLMEEGNVWLDGTPSSQEAEIVLQRFSLPPSILKSYREETKPVRKVSERHKMLILQELNYEEELAVSPMLVLLGERLLITIRENSIACDETYERIEEEIHQYGHYRPELVAYMIAEQLGQLSFRAVERLEEKTWHVEEELTEARDFGSVKKSAALRRELMSVNKVNYVLAEILLSAMKELPPDLRDCGIGVLIEEVHDSFIRQIGTVDELRAILLEGLEIYSSRAVTAIAVASNRFNIEIRDLTVVLLFLTVISTIYLFPNTVATIMGIPGLASRLNIPEILIIIAISTVLPTVWILRQRWVKNFYSRGLEIPVIPFIPFVTVGEKAGNKHDKKRQRKAG